MTAIQYLHDAPFYFMHLGDSTCKFPMLSRQYIPKHGSMPSLRRYIAVMIVSYHMILSQQFIRHYLQKHDLIQLLDAPSAEIQSPRPRRFRLYQQPGLPRSMRISFPERDKPACTRVHYHMIGDHNEHHIER